MLFHDAPATINTWCLLITIALTAQWEKESLFVTLNWFERQYKLHTPKSVGHEGSKAWTLSAVPHFSLSPPRVAFSRVEWFSRALEFRSLYYPWGKMGDFHVTSSPPCWWTVNKRSLISSLCLSTSLPRRRSYGFVTQSLQRTFAWEAICQSISICSFHHCYLCLPRLHENNLLWVRFY